ncbi:MAG: class I SAM-dependent methyltransferase [Steroidobacterales bacterium]
MHDQSFLNNRKLQRNVSRLIRGRRTFMRLKSPGLVLDVGCGPNARPANLNLDFQWRPGVDICCDITRALPLDDSYVSGVFSEHCLEHIPFKAALAVLAEFHRVMQPGAYARIIVPDFEIYVDQYIRFRNTGQASMPYADDDPIGGIYTPMLSINRIFRGHRHQFIYDFATLSGMLAQAGFIDIGRRRFGESCDQRLLLDSPDRAIESLYVEARKTLTGPAVTEGCPQ